jgi:tRNA uridine 5-carboxymethylaminomethyl modification enzyme
MPKAYSLGLISESLYKDFLIEQECITQTLTAIVGNKSLYTTIMRAFEGDDICGVTVLRQYLPATMLGDRALRTIHAELLYAPYLVREEKEVERLEQYQSMRIPDEFVYTNMPGLSKELQHKLTKVRPATVAAASLIPGMTPAAISLLIFKIRYA